MSVGPKVILNGPQVQKNAMSLLDKYDRNGAKDDLMRGLTTGNLSHRFEVIREYTKDIGGRNIVGNTLGTIFFLPWVVVGLIFVVVSFFIIFNPHGESEAPFYLGFCTLFMGSIAFMIGFSAVRNSVGEVINPDDYVKYETAVYFNRHEGYLAEVEIIIDATDENLIGDITLIDEIHITKKCEIFCRYHPGSDGAVRPDFNDFIISHGNVSIQLDGHTFLNDKKRIAIAKEWSEKLGVKIGEPLVR